MGRIKAVRGDITTISADAIVNPANSFGYMGGGVAGVIKRKGGIEIEKEAVKKAPIPVGKAIATTAGKLKYRCVIHAPTMERPAMRIGIDNVEKATKAALELSRKLGLKIIAIPGMGTGVGGISEREAAKIMVKVAKTFENDFEEIIFVDINESMVEAWERELNQSLISRV